MGGQLVQPDEVELGQGVAGGGDHDEVLLEERFHDDVVVVDGEVDHGQVEGAGQQLGEQRGGVALQDADAHLGVAPGHGGQEGGEQPASGGAEDSQADVAGDLVAHRGDVGHEGVELALDPAGPGDHGQAFLGEPARRAIHQDGAQLPLQAGDVGGHVRLHGVEPGGRGREGAHLVDGDEGGELAQIHRQE